MSKKKDRRKARRRAEKWMEEAWNALAADDLSMALKLASQASIEGPPNPRIWNDHATLLVECGARNEPDRMGIRPSRRAEERGHERVARILLTHG